MEFKKIHEYDMNPVLEKEIHNLLAESFPDFYQNDRIYYKQLPHFRYLAFDNNTLIGHIALDYRVMNLNADIIKVLGIIDVCVKKEYRGKGIASELLGKVEAFAVEHGMDFLLLLADDAKLYEKNGFIRTKNSCKWVKINEHITLGIGEEKIEELMIKKTGKKNWEKGYLDMLGYMY